MLELLDAPPPLPEGWKRAGLISDTHDRVRPAVFGLLDGCEAILHAGDLTTAKVLAELEAIAPVHAVAGNCDWNETRGLGDWKRVDFPFGAVALAHGHLFARHLLNEELLAKFRAWPELRLIVHGHTHVAHLTDMGGGVWITNPGSASEPRDRPEPSLAFLDYDAQTPGEFRVRHVAIP